MGDAGGPRLLGIEPQLYVTDLAAALGFFRDRLGFDLSFVHGEPPFYGQVVRGDVRINLRHLDRPLIDATLMDREPDLICASIQVSDARRLFEEFESRGAAFHQRLQRPPWGGEQTADFIVTGPDRNLIHFVSHAG